MSRRGQLLVLAALLLSWAVLNYLAWYSAGHRPYVIARFCGPLESAELIAAARASIAWNQSLDYVLTRLRELGRQYGHCVELYNVTYSVSRGDSYYKVVYSIPFLESKGLQGQVSYVATWNSSLEGFYIKETPYGALIYALYRVKYINYYSAPQWGTVEYCPSLEAPSEVDLWRLTSCEWLVGIPANSTVTLRDEFGVPIEVGG